MRELALFAGAGGGLLASRLLGWRTVGAVEIDPYCRSRLLDRQHDGCLPEFPIWDDVCTFDGRSWRGRVDVISGGFPCQDISAAGQGTGLAGSRSGLVFEMLRIVDEVRPAFVFAENSPQLRTKGLAILVERFISMGYMGRVGVLGAGDIGANHIRKRMWIVAVDTRIGCGPRGTGRSTSGTAGQQELPFFVGEVAYPHGTRREGWYKSADHAEPVIDASRGSFEFTSDADDPRRLQPAWGIREIGRWPRDGVEFTSDADGESVRQQSRGRGGANGETPTKFGIVDWWSVPRFTGVVDGVADRVDRIKATGNGQVPGVAALAWSVLTCDLFGETWHDSTSID